MFEVLGGEGGGCVWQGCLTPPTPGKDGLSTQALFYSYCVFRAFQESSGEPYFHLRAATCSLGPQACRCRLGLNRRDRKKRKALVSQWAALALDLSLEREKRGESCVGGRRLGPSPRLRSQQLAQGVGVQQRWKAGAVSAAG